VTQLIFYSTCDTTIISVWIFKTTLTTVRPTKCKETEKCNETEETSAKSATSTGK